MLHTHTHSHVYTHIHRFGLKTCGRMEDGGRHEEQSGSGRQAGRQMTTTMMMGVSTVVSEKHR